MEYQHALMMQHQAANPQHSVFVVLPDPRRCCNRSRRSRGRQHESLMQLPDAFILSAYNRLGGVGDYRQRWPAQRRSAVQAGTAESENFFVRRMTALGCMRQRWWSFCDAGWPLPKFTQKGKGHINAKNAKKKRKPSIFKDIH